MSTNDPTEELPKLDLLIKMMKMTDAEDPVSLVALRKANTMLRDNGWDWERLLRGKVKIIANPFAAGGPTIPPIETRKAAPPQPQPPPPPPVNPWPNGQRPTANKRPSDPYRNTQAPPPPRPAAPAVAPPGPLHFRKTSNDVWAIASHIRIDSTIGQQVWLEKRDGSKSQETVGHFIEQLPTGHYLYSIAKASKWKRRSADQFNINDLTP